MRNLRTYLFLMATLLLAAACQNDAYDTGDGSLSYMRADFVEAATDASAHIVKVTTDDDQTLFLSPALQTSLATTPDSTYRLMLYYNVSRQTSSATTTVEPISAVSVLVAKVQGAVRNLSELPTDPVGITTSWKSANGRYINFELAIKVGTVDGEMGSQSLGAVCYAQEQTAGGKNKYTVRLLHDQNGVPRYYTATAYVSIPLYNFPSALSSGDTIEVEVNTDGGYVVKTFEI